MKKVRILPLILVVVLMAGVFSGCGAKPSSGGVSPSGGTSPSPNSVSQQATTASSYDDVYKALNAALTQGEYGRDDGVSWAGAAQPETAAAAPMPAPADSAPALGGDKTGSSADSDYSQTNTQVAGVDEGDIVKTDGQYIYVLRQNELIIFKADGASTVRVGSIMVADKHTQDKPMYQESTVVPEVQAYINEYASDIYVSGNTAVVISSYYSYMPYYADGAIARDGIAKAEIMPPINDNRQIAKVRIIDITNRSKPVMAAELGQDGNVLASRLIGSTLYLISNYYVYNADKDDNTTYVPRLYTGSDERIMSPDSIAIMPIVSSTAYTVVCSYDLEKAALNDSMSVLGGGSTVYMNQNALYVANSISKQTAGAPYTDSVYSVIDYTSTNMTDIVRFDLSGGGLKLAASGTVPGSMYGQFALDEYNGNLRVVTSTYSQSWSEYTDKAKGFVNYVWKDPV